MARRFPDIAFLRLPVTDGSANTSFAMEKVTQLRLNAASLTLVQLAQARHYAQVVCPFAIQNSSAPDPRTGAAGAHDAGGAAAGRPPGAARGRPLALLHAARLHAAAAGAGVLEHNLSTKCSRYAAEFDSTAVLAIFTASTEHDQQ